MKKMHLLSEKTALNKNVTAEIKECLSEPPHIACFDMKYSLLLLSVVFLLFLEWKSSTKLSQI